jgi:putative transposase
MIRYHLSYSLSLFKSHITFKMLQVLVVLSHIRGRIIRFNVTPHPTAWSCSQQLRCAFCDLQPPGFLLRDYETKFEELFTEAFIAPGIDPPLIAYRSPCQNGYVERLLEGFGRNCNEERHLLF